MLRFQYSNNSSSYSQSIRTQDKQLKAKSIDNTVQKAKKIRPLIQWKLYKNVRRCFADTAEKRMKKIRTSRSTLAVRASATKVKILPPNQPVIHCTPLNIMRKCVLWRNAVPQRGTVLILGSIVCEKHALRRQEPLIRLEDSVVARLDAPAHGRGRGLGPLRLKRGGHRLLRRRQMTTVNGEMRRRGIGLFPSKNVHGQRLRSARYVTAAACVMLLSRKPVLQDLTGHVVRRLDLECVRVRVDRVVQRVSKLEIGGKELVSLFAAEIGFRNAAWVVRSLLLVRQSSARGGSIAWMIRSRLR